MLEKNCQGLHAGIKAQLFGQDSGSGGEVDLTFALLNDGNTPVYSPEKSWKIAIDGVEIDDSIMPIFSNGALQPNKTLNPGEMRGHFGVGLSLNKYFPEAREYKVSWRGEGFQSPTITITTSKILHELRPVTESECQPLRAGITAQLIRQNPPFDSYVSLSFILLNDGDMPVHIPSEGTWRIVIDGQELGESAMIFGNGVSHVDTLATEDPNILFPGATQEESSKGLDMNRYFPEAREYKVSWRGDGFQSPTVTVTIPPIPN